MKATVNIMWFRRDLRLHDNAALYHALTAGLPVVPIFIFDTDILDRLEDKHDRRVAFIHEALQHMQQQLVSMDSSLEVLHGKPLEVFRQLLDKYEVQQVFTNHDHEQYGINRDKAVGQLLASLGKQLNTYKDHVILEKGEVLKDDGKPYTVFTPYSKKWKAVLKEEHLRSFDTAAHFQAFHRQAPVPMPTLQQIGFTSSDEAHAMPFPSATWKEDTIRQYQEQRNFPGMESTTRLGVHLRFGTISIRELARATRPLSETFLNELIWRDFYHMIIWHFPHVCEGKAFRQEYDHIQWRNNEQEFEAWCQGNTGYPIVDAGMRELNATGFMHNRVRMIVASFLVKHLLIDWRWGEAYFAKKLLDFDFAANNGGWQWAAGSGCDAAPYFRVFNPTLQTQKFDTQLRYIRKWVPEFESFSYPRPIVVHEVARKRVLEVYAKALKP